MEIKKEHIDKALEVQKEIFNQVDDVAEGKELNYIVAAYNAKIAILYSKLESCKQEEANEDKSV
jgi:hypothetical protein